MTISITDQNIEIQTIQDLILSDIQLSLICERLEQYEYDMSWIIKKKYEIRQELERKLNGEKERKMRKLEAQREALLPNDIKLKNIEAEIETLRSKK